MIGGTRTDTVVDRPPRRRDVVRLALGIPLFYKLLIANSLIVIVGAIGGSALTAAFVRDAPERSTIELVGWLATLGALVSVLVNALILRLALSPIWTMEETANAIRSGDLDARVPTSLVADRDFRRLAATFNAMLDQGRDHRARLRRLASDATRAAESERKRIAQELHDGTAQTLAALLIRLKLVTGVDDPEKRMELLQDLRDQLSAALDDVRRTAHALRPEVLEDLGLGAAIEHHARGLEEKEGPRVQVDPPPEGLSMAPHVELALYRIIQEAMTNAARHAAATTVRVRWQRRGDALVTLIEDDGSGFDVEESMRRRDRLGLFGMIERASYLGGDVAIDSHQGSGTTVRVTLPLSRSADG